MFPRIFRSIVLGNDAVFPRRDSHFHQHDATSLGIRRLPSSPRHIAARCRLGSLRPSRHQSCLARHDITSFGTTTASLDTTHSFHGTTNCCSMSPDQNVIGRRETFHCLETEVGPDCSIRGMMEHLCAPVTPILPARHYTSTASHDKSTFLWPYYARKQAPA